MMHGLMGCGRLEWAGAAHGAAASASKNYSGVSITPFDCFRVIISRLCTDYRLPHYSTIDDFSLLSTFHMEHGGVVFACCFESSASASASASISLVRSVLGSLLLIVPS